MMPDTYTWQWNGNFNYDYTVQPFSGTKAINIVGTSGYTGLQFNRDYSFSTKGYDYLRFALKGSQLGQDYTIQMTGSGGSSLSGEINISTYAGRVDMGDYTLYTIPLADLNAQNVNANGVILQNQNSSAQPSVVFDKVQLVPAVDTVNVVSEQSTFAYDAVDRLLSAAYPYGSYTYTYDAAGNRLTSNENSIQSTYSYNTDNQLNSKSSRTFTYDSQGNQISDGSKTLAYDYEDRLTTYTDPNGQTVNYVYDGAGNRIRKNVVSGSSYRYTNDVSGELSRVLVNKNTTANSSTYYAYAGGLLSQGDSSSSSRQYYLDDGMGNIRYTTGNNGASIQEYTYDPYGNIITGNGSNFSYQQQEKDAENGLTYLRARYYDSTTGRFTSRDPIAGILTDTQTQNGYNYANANPINRTDPSGKIPPLIIWGIGGILTVWTAYDVYDSVQNCDYNGAAINSIGFLPFGGITKIPSKLGSLIAKGHAATKHMDEFASVGVRTVDEFGALIQKTVNNPTVIKQLDRGRTAFYDTNTKMLVIHDPFSIDSGTAFKTSLDYFNNNLK